MSEEASESKFKVSAEDLRSVPWKELLAAEQQKECSRYIQVFGRAARECKDSGDQLGEKAYGFLHTLASFWPNYSSSAFPYGPMRTEADGTRTLVPEDLLDGDLDALKEIVEEIEDAEFRARIADVLWICRKDFKAAQLAVDSFVESAGTLKTRNPWPTFTERLDRAARIAALRGFETQCQSVVKFVEGAILEYENNNEAGLLCSHLMQILLGLEEGDIQRYADLSERLAGVFATEGEWHFSEIYWQVAVQWHRRAKDEVNILRCLVEAAEADISRGKQGLEKDPPQISFAARWLGKGVEGLRQAKADPERIEEVHREFLRLQKEALSELEPIGFDEDRIEGLKENREATQKAAAEHVSEKEFVEAIGRFAYIKNPTNLEKLKEREVKASEGMIWDKLFGAVALDKDGKVADTMPAIGFDEADQDEAALRKRLVQSAGNIDWGVSVVWYLEPARCAIIAEHPVRPRDLLFLVENNPFIPPGHQGIYLRGIHAGFYGDWLVAMHLLIPQLEASLRHVLQQHGVITSTLDSDGTQKERDINQLLWLEKVEEIFGQNFLFDLRGILIERFGRNMRNESAHGLMPEYGFYQNESVYLWWLVIRLCWIGFAGSQPGGESENENLEEESE